MARVLAVLISLLLSHSGNALASFCPKILSGSDSSDSVQHSQIPEHNLSALTQIVSMGSKFHFSQGSVIAILATGQVEAFGLETNSRLESLNSESHTLMAIGKVSDGALQWISRSDSGKWHHTVLSKTESSTTWLKANTQEQPNIENNLRQMGFTGENGVLLGELLGQKYLYLSSNRKFYRSTQTGKLIPPDGRITATREVTSPGSKESLLILSIETPRATYELTATPQTRGRVMNSLRLKAEIGSLTAEELGVFRESFDPNLNGRTHEYLERLMRPRQESIDGFLGHDESLKKILEEDAREVGATGYSHQDLAFAMEWVLQIGKIFYQQDSKKKIHRFDFKNVPFALHIHKHVGYQESPFGDGMSADHNLSIQNLLNGETLHFSALMPSMIGRYGFYEGRATPYRVEPSQIIRVLGPFLPESAQK